MPRTKTDYNTNNSVIYRIKCNDSNCEFTYIGATTNFTHRKSQHKYSCNNVNSTDYNYFVYETIRKNGGWDKWNMNIIEIFPCESKQHLHIREQWHIDQQEHKMNLQRAFITLERKLELIELKKGYDEIYRDDNRDNIKDTKHKYYENNKDEINAISKAYYENNKDEMNANSRAYYENNKDEINKKRKIYCDAHKADKSEYDKKRREAKKQAVT